MSKPFLTFLVLVALMTSTDIIQAQSQSEVDSSDSNSEESSSDGSVLVGASVEEQRAADANDPMQQVINYLVTGNPLSRKRMDISGTSGAEAFILSREDCVMGFALKNPLASDTIEMWFNNVDPDSIEFETRYVNEQVASLQALEEGFNTFIKLSGYPVAISTSSGVRLESESVLLGDIDVNRAREALDLLYGDFCQGKESETAF